MFSQFLHCVCIKLEHSDCKHEEAACLSATSIRLRTQFTDGFAVNGRIISHGLIQQLLGLLTSLCTARREQMVAPCLCTYSTYVGQVHQDCWLPWELGIKHDCNLSEKSTCGRAPALTPRPPPFHPLAVNPFGLSHRLCRDIDWWRADDVENHARCWFERSFNEEGD